MALKQINLGEYVNDGTGDDLRTAFLKVNDNFIEIDRRGGQANTVSNAGTGIGLYKEKVGVDLIFKTIKNGNGIVLTSSNNEITIAATSSKLEDELSPKLNANLDLNGNDIVDLLGTGAIYGNFLGTINNVNAAKITTDVELLNKDVLSFDFGPIVRRDIDGNVDSVGFTQWLKENINIDFGSFFSEGVGIGSGGSSGGGGDSNLPSDASGYLKNDGFGNLSWSYVSSIPANGLTGDTLPSNILYSSLTSIGTLGNLTVIDTINGSITGNAGSVTHGVYTTDTGTVTNDMLAGNIANSKLANNSITINGSSVSLGGSITVASSAAAAGSLTGNTLASNVVNSSLTSVGTLTNLTVTNVINGSISGNANTASSVTNGVYTTGPQTIGGIKTFTSTISGSISGNAATVTNGVYTSSTYADPSWITSLAGNKISGAVSTANTVTNGVYTYDIGTVTNTMLAGNIANNKLANSSITINGTAISLGGSVTIDTGTSGSSGAIATRNTFVRTTQSIGVGIADTLEITAYKGYVLYSIETDKAAWVIVYTSTASRTADSTRLITDDPLPGSGVVAEAITTGAQKIYFTPGTIGFSSETVPTTSIPVRVYNKGTIPGTIQVTFTLLQLEDAGITTRNITANTINGLGAGASGTLEITGFKTYSILAIETSYAAWVTLYTSTSNRTADASRAITSDPAPNSGVIAEAITTGAQKVYFTPAIVGYSAESSPTTSIPIKVYNNGAGTSNITVTLTLLQMEL